MKKGGHTNSVYDFNSKTFGPELTDDCTFLYGLDTNKKDVFSILKLNS